MSLSRGFASINRTTCALQLPPASRPIVGSDLLEHVGERACVDLLALVDGYCSSGFVVVPACNDAFGIGDYTPVIQKDVYMIFRGQQSADVAFKHEVRLAGALDGFFYLGVGSVDQCANFAADLLLPGRK